MTNAPSSPAGGAVQRTEEDVRLARIHLRMGQLLLARAELEDLLRRDQLDTTCLATLAEVRWRTGDASGAAAAADEHLAAGGSDDVAVCIAAEAAALDGRQEDAHALMERLPAADATALDAMFAGIPRRAYWPAGPVELADIDDLRHTLDGGRDAARRGGPLRAAGPGRAAADAPTQLYGQADLGLAEGSTAALPEGMPAGPAGPQPPVPRHAPATSSTRHRKGQLDASLELARARDELDANPDRAFLRLALVLRLDPTRAPAVLDVLHLRREPGAALLRGDAQRLLGRHLEAEAAYDAAAETLEAS